LAQALDRFRPDRQIDLHGITKRSKRLLMTTYLSPKVLALAIGVSESSLKRWADEGRLTVERTAGGHRRIPLAEAVHFIRRSGLTPVRPELLRLPGDALVAGRQAADRATAAERLYDALLRDRSAEARSLLLSLYLDGASLAWLCDDVIRGALARIGDLWQHDARGVFLEHRAIETCTRSLVQLRLLLPAAADDAPRAVGGAFEGDVYQIPSAMAALVLAGTGYSAENLGADTPATALVAALQHYRPRLIWLSFSAPPRNPRDAGRALDELADEAGDAALVVGGRGAGDVPLPDRPDVHRLGSMAELSAFARGLVAPPRP
jgi:MerR family transcriptional regulator, light-induced transcriptional regulator